MNVELRLESRDSTMQNSLTQLNKYYNIWAT